MNETTMDFGEWMGALGRLVKSKVVTALAVQPSPAWEAYHELGLTPEQAFATVLHDELETWGIRIRVACLSEEPSGEVMALDEWMAALDDSTKRMTGTRITVVPSHIWLADYRKGLTPEQSFSEVVGQVIRDIGVQLELAGGTDGVEDRAL